jgi:hypothetical protein
VAPRRRARALARTAGGAALALPWRGGAGQRAPRLELEPDHADPTAGGEIVEGKLRRPRRADPKP